MVPPFEYDKSVFINCPFDGAYRPLFEAIVFAVFDCGFEPRCALETEDAGQVRMEKIFDLIEDCRFAINDLSRIELDSATNLPRFNMPRAGNFPRGTKVWSWEASGKALSDPGPRTLSLPNLHVRYRGTGHSGARR
jgi:hypothetical protein